VAAQVVPKSFAVKGSPHEPVDLIEQIILRKPGLIGGGFEKIAAISNKLTPLCEMIEEQGQLFRAKQRGEV
jgi:hypothetical protein